MNEASNVYLRKTVFWQRVAAIVLTLFLATMWGLAIYQFIDVISDVSVSTIMEKEMYYLFFICFGYLAVASYLDFILFKASSVLNQYLKNGDMLYLEIAFRKQRHFWMGLTLAILSIFLVGIGFAFLISNLR